MRQRELVIHDAVMQMLAIEESFDRALTNQIDDFEASNPDTVLHLKYVATFVTAHLAQLRELEERNETFAGRLGSGFRRAGSMLAGFGGSAVGFVRNETLPDQLRRDCGMASLVYAGYRSLFTTASALRDGAVCRLAAEFLADYARITLILQDLLPDAVVTQLETDGLRLEGPAIRSRNSNRIEGVPVHAG
ncbi:MAG TPA: hypothetical protein VJU15_12875 [Gemmatimonadales bacterium]|nr:hypothetical protein [Gemmatimonadales bacterium]